MIAHLKKIILFYCPWRTEKWSKAGKAEKKAIAFYVYFYMHMCVLIYKTRG